MDPNAKKLKAQKRYGRALDLIRQGVQLNQWSIGALDDGLYVVGKKEMVAYVQEIIAVYAQQEMRVKEPASSTDLGASKE